MGKEYSTLSKTDDWKFVVFCLCLDLAGINSHTILKYNLGEDKVPTRREVLKMVVQSLTSDWVKKRRENPNMQEPIKEAIDQILLSYDPYYTPPVIATSTPSQQQVDGDIEQNIIPSPKEKKCHLCIASLAGLSTDERRKKKGIYIK